MVRDDLPFSEEMWGTARERMKEVFEWQDSNSTHGCTDSACSHHPPYQDEIQSLRSSKEGELLRKQNSALEDAIALKKATTCAVQHDFVVGPTHAVCNRCEKVIVLPTASLGKPMH